MDQIKRAQIKQLGDKIKESADEDARIRKDLVNPAKTGKEKERTLKTLERASNQRIKWLQKIIDIVEKDSAAS
jgi:hypothetical protein